MAAPSGDPRLLTKSRPAGCSSGTPGPLPSVTSPRTTPSLALTATVTVSPGAPEAAPDAAAEYLPQQGGVILARVPRAEHLEDVRRGIPRGPVPSYWLNQ